MVEIICKLSNLKFESETKRTQVHPKIAAWKQEAYRRGWYARCMKAIQYGVSEGFTTIKQFDEVLGRAERGEPLDGLRDFDDRPTSPVIEALDQAWGYELDRQKGSFCRQIKSINTNFNSGYSLLGDQVDMTTKFADGLYIDCATEQPSNTDIRKWRKPYSCYTIFTIKDGAMQSLLKFRGRRLSECGELLAEVWQIALNNGLEDAAEA